ncbi:MAG: nucleotidyltransferase domain-containing protein [Dehalococcoidia bacterium]|nr:nucleotidyltransferase domain-containing protein [Dehalococcoidia bacterium]
MHRQYRARLYLFGSRARGNATSESDYDLVVVAKAFGEQHILHRAPDRRLLWREAGGWGISLDLHCYTPEEFRAEIRGLGYLGQAKRRGELVAIKTSAAQKSVKQASISPPVPN